MISRMKAPASVIDFAGDPVYFDREIPCGGYFLRYVAYFYRFYF